jgi:adenylate kinase family enzyme
MKRILLIGPGGSGKSTLANKLGEVLGLEVIHLDRYYWSAGWVELPKNKWAITVDELLSRESWVMDGNYSGTLAKRIPASDTIIFLDLPMPQCLWRIIKRQLKFRGTTRPDMAPGCPERLSLQFILWVSKYSQDTRPKVLRLIKELGSTKTVVHLRSSREVNKFLSELETGAFNDNRNRRQRA